MDYYCSCRTEIDNMKGEFTSDELTDGKIFQFKLDLKVDIYNWTRDPDSTTRIFQGRNPTSTHTTVAVSAPRESLKRCYIHEVVNRSFDICDYYVPTNQRRDAIARAWEEVSKIFEADQTLSDACGFVKLDCIVWMRHDHVYDHIPTDYPRMVPASDFSIGMLEEYEVGGDAGCCCVCLEEIAGGGCLRMPCAHVFHGDCIKEWLRTSHYCPLCRYEMPTQ